MASFSTLWRNHAGSGYVCDQSVFANQCAMRMGQALDDSNVDFPRTGLRTCVGYNRSRFADHAPGHIRSAQQLANVFKNNPTLLGGTTTYQKFSGTMNDNLSTLKNVNGMIFILNGWDSTDHIDLWNGTSLKGGNSSYFGRGAEVWFWNIA